MDEIEAGFNKMLEKVSQYEKKEADLSDQVRKADAELLSRMAELTIPVIVKIGLNMLDKGKQDTKGELYDSVFYPKKMIVLGKAEAAAFRPDDISKKVTDQFCVLSEEGKFYEMMYSSDGFIVDSYLNPVTAQEALSIYGFEVIFMLYRAIHDYVQGHEKLVESLEKTIEFVFPDK